MKKIYMKLTASVLSILIACTMIVGVTYAWMVLSTSPEVGNISMTIGGGRTILLAPDLTVTVTDEDGRERIVHYPGKFSANLNFSQYETYEYLKTIGGLSPVSTADGKYFILPAYEEETGMIKDISDFTVDKNLRYANAENGCYAYVDFWVVSPGTEKTLRVSMDTKTGDGSYLIELPGVEKNENDRLQLAQTQGITESIARIGFLVNTDSAGEAAKAFYSDYTELLGVYPEKGQEVEKERNYQFTIYEPNGISHPLLEEAAGAYLITRPLEYSPYGRSIMETEVKDRLMIQLTNTFRTFQTQTQLEQIFQSSIINQGELTEEQAADRFYEEYLQGQISTYIKSGMFLKSTSQIYALAENGKVSPEALAAETAGAVDDTSITILSPNVPQRVRMYLWLEGQDPDCVNTTSVAASGLSVNIEFSGADQ